MHSPDKHEALERRMESLGIFEEDLIEKFIRGTGSGGQKINKTSSCVFLLHPSTGIKIKVQRDRSRKINRFLAREELCRRLETKAQSESLARQNAREKKRRRHRPAAPAPGPAISKKNAATGKKNRTGVVPGHRISPFRLNTLSPFRKLSPCRPTSISSPTFWNMARNEATAPVPEP